SRSLNPPLGLLNLLMAAAWSALSSVTAFCSMVLASAAVPVCCATATPESPKPESPAALLGDDVVDIDGAGNTTLRVEHHRPIEAGDLAGPQAGLDREQDHRAVSGGERRV